jgi:hypothetical protein
MSLRITPFLMTIGHIKGEDVCPGCDFSGDMPHQRHNMINPDLN